MPQSHVLIVDDSKTAQVRLRKMLECYPLKIDTAASAEEALSYLSYQSPAVVFMDHHMEGMDGLEALRIIKSNPATAMIPVIMYTAEKGDVYVGQARAMGALDILSKEIIKPSSLAKVLSSLKIRPWTEDVEPEKTLESDESPDTQPQPSGSSVGNSAAGSSELQAVRNQIARLFEIHIADVRQQVSDSTKFMVRRLSKDFEDRLTSSKANADVEELSLPPEPRSEGSTLNTFFSALILFGLLLVAYQIVSAGKEQRELIRGFGELAATAERQGKLLQDLAERPELRTASSRAGSGASAGKGVSAATPDTTVDQVLLLQAVSWAMGLNPQFAYGQPALGEARTGDFAQLLNLLDAARYRGIVFVDLHFGNFCVVQAGNGELVLPEASATMAECNLLADLISEPSVDDQLSLGFVRFMQTQPALVQKRLDLRLNSRGFDDTRYSYPTAMPDLKAADWNASAQRNNRIALSFSPFPIDSM